MRHSTTSSLSPSGSNTNGKVGYLFAALCALALVACSGAPGERDARPLIEQQLAKNTEYLSILGISITLEDFSMKACKKTKMAKTDVWTCPTSLLLNNSMTGRYGQDLEIQYSKIDGKWVMID